MVETTMSFTSRKPHTWENYSIALNIIMLCSRRWYNRLVARKCYSTLVLYDGNMEPVPPTIIISHGTDRDLSRSFGWEGLVPFSRKSSIKKPLRKAKNGPIRRLDS